MSEEIKEKVVDSQEQNQETQQQTKEKSEDIVSQIESVLPNVLTKKFQNLTQKIVKDNLDKLENELGTDGRKAIMEDFNIVMDSEYGDQELKQELIDNILHTNPKFLKFISKIAKLLKEEKSLESNKTEQPKDITFDEVL